MGRDGFGMIQALYIIMHFISDDGFGMIQALYIIMHFSSDLLPLLI